MFKKLCHTLAAVAMACAAASPLYAQNGPTDFGAVADSLHNVMERKFCRDWHGGKYLIHSWNADPAKENKGYNYWWMAHAVDACTDAYIRTGDSRHTRMARDIRQGMYVAYDDSRPDLWNNFYDDMEWMCLACIRASLNTDTGAEKWLDEARQLFDWIWEGWNYDDGSEGGIRWTHDDNGKGKNSCANAPAMIAAAKLYRLTGEQHYLDKALMIFEWMLGHSRFDDGLIKDSPSNDNRDWAFTYNQGTWFGGLLELYRITGDRKFYDTATEIIDKTISDPDYAPGGIIRNQGTGDGGLFNGIYIRYLTDWITSGLLDDRRREEYAAFIERNAQSMYDNALDMSDYTVSPDWRCAPESDDYHSSVLLSAIFLSESIDTLRRAGLADGKRTNQVSRNTK